MSDLFEAWGRGVAVLLETLTGKCRYSDRCQYYQADHYICNHDAGPYCGVYRHPERITGDELGFYAAYAEEEEYHRPKYFTREVSR